MEKINNFKNISLEFYGEEVEVLVKENSPSYKPYNTSTFKGVLFKRTWGYMLRGENPQDDTVIAITLKVNTEYIEIFCEDIVSINKKVFNQMQGEQK